MQIIRTQRLLLRPHALADFDPWFAMFTDPRTVASLGMPVPSREDCWHRLFRYAGHWSLLGYGMFAVFELAGGAFVGEVGIANFHRGIGPKFDGSPEAAWSIVQGAHGRGYGIEATSACHHWFESEHGYQRTVCLINPDNGRSLQLASKLGYRPYDYCAYKEGRYVTLQRQGAQS